MNADLCITCPNRDRGFCGALKGSENGAAPAGLDNHFKVARKGQIVSAMRPRSDDVIVICEGWAFEYLHWPQGRRQILRFLSAGDVLHPDGILSDAAALGHRAAVAIHLHGKDVAGHESLVAPDIIPPRQ